LIEPGHLALFRLPQADGAPGKLRPVLVLKKVPGNFDDWLVCMVTSKFQHYQPEFDEIVNEEADDYCQSGLKAASCIRICRVAIIDSAVLLGSIGSIQQERLRRIQNKLAGWLSS
jgi:mRNA interferase MazF